uniref:L1 transposable element RRM domain-containing protein n=1 Tax=Oreochromis aureus TaxID=47969 RepID=A0AAZ1XUY6_OREAU
MSKGRRQTEKNLTAESCANAGAAEDASAALNPALVALLEQHRTAIAADFKATSDVINGKLDKIQAEVANQQLRIGELETNSADVVRRLAALKAKYDSLQEETKLFKTKLSDLESRSRRQNICLVGLPESVEPGPRATEFFSRLLVEVFSAQTLPFPPELDRAHRSLMPKPGPDGRPRSIIIRFHRFQIKELLMREARRRRGTLEYCGHKLQFYEDYNIDVQKQRAQYKDVMAELYRRGLRPSLLFPAR